MEAAVNGWRCCRRRKKTNCTDTNLRRQGVTAAVALLITYLTIIELLVWMSVMSLSFSVFVPLKCQKVREILQKVT